MSRRQKRNRKKLRRALIATGAVAAAAGTAHAAIITVNSAGDDTTPGNGLCTLREALANANTDTQTTGGECTQGNGADTIAFNLPNPSTITVGSTLNITDSVTIAGPGATKLTVSGNNANRVFYIYNNAQTLDVTLSGMTIAGGNAANGSAVMDKGETVTLDAVTVTGNTGDAVEVTAAGSLTVQDSTITGTTKGNGIAAIYFNALTVTSSTISYNQGNYPGGGIAALFGTGPVQIRDTTITGNVAGPLGGGVALLKLGSAATISHSTITQNSALYAGGGIALYSNYAPVTVSDTTISGNSSAAFGGGVAVANSVTDVTFQDTTIAGNTAGSGAGIIFRGQAPGATNLIERTTISGNTASGQQALGGGIYFYSLYGASILENATISGNSAGTGGGIFDEGEYASATLDIHNTTITGNTAAVKAGNAALYYFPSVTIRNSIIANGSAPQFPDLYTGSSNVQMNFSLLENTSGATFTGSNNLTGVDPVLGPLANNGGPTQTHKPLTGSPVIDAGDPAFVPPPTTDQRGFARVSGAHIDMGSVELQAAANLSVVKTGPPTGVVGQPVTYTITVSNGGPNSAFGVTVSDTLPPNSTFVAATPSQGSCTDAATVTCSLGTIANGAGATIQLQVTPTASGTLTNTATVATAPEADTSLGNNTSQASVTISAATAVPTLGLLGRLMLAISMAFLGLFMVKKE